MEERKKREEETQSGMFVSVGGKLLHGSGRGMGVAGSGDEGDMGGGGVNKV